MVINHVRFFESIENAPIASRMGLIRVLAVVAIAVISGSSHGAAMQLISVREISSGVVSATVGLFTAEPAKPSDFWLRFDGSAIRAKEVKSARSVSPGISVVFCIDQSDSMGRTAIQQIRAALKDVVVNPVFPLNTALWVFDSEVTKLHGFSRDGPELAAAIDEIGTGSRQGGKAKLYEAIALTLSELRNYRTEGPERLILITAGKDGGSSITGQVVINEANAQNIEIDVVGFGNISDTGSELLARLARNTDGHFIFAGNASQLAYELRKLLDLTSVQVVNVIFQYQTREELYRVSAARLEFAPDDQTPVSLPIGRGLAAPWAAPFGGGLSDHPASKQEVGRMIFQWITVGATGYIGYLAVYLLRRKRTKSVPKDRSAPGNDKDSKGP